ncbi:DUF72 domain-containing protein [Aquifex aeolicus]|uniref:DUF72 domain-containing protein n=1 Tax=Aquifex aeolicus (strain VF5) TaxID=224324 RepID=O67070_AQUAE|nr:DUF72 domain-containing protein [Aquifex aeolicus]AAC07036.1 putative protein [Aquifex aeolicus VF5]
MGKERTEGSKLYYLGCSGYFYPGWRGKFYPKDLKPKDWLKYYSKFFNTVEINSTFYHFPNEKNLRRLYRETPKDFKFSVKVNRNITHYRKFKDVKELIKNFYEVCRNGLREKLGCVLFQLPPSYTYTKENLERILENLDFGFKNVLEFRHISWWNEEVFKILKERNVTFCSVSAPNLPESLIETSETVYIRFHGKTSWYKYNYSERELKSWAKKIKKSGAKEIFAYFNNDYNAYAPQNCLKLKELLGLLTVN